ncbi:serine/threonine protein kinase [Acidobacteria bacterium AH-259-L09]|nr:serine/threonine protein kinase [Acidobacteria bacterium AH-259-L09]
MVGQTISHYRVLEKLGEGGMGEVFLAQDTSLDRKVALKFLPEFLQEDPIACKRFLREAKSAAALDHPYICKIYEVGEAEGKDFIAMEYVPGETLRDRLARGPLPFKEALQKAAEVAEALEKAHATGIVHRDLKPSNIMLTPEGHVKVMDFGLAKQLTPAEGLVGQEETISGSLTKTGTTLGTLAYMSPEQMRGQRVDTRSDIFSFGVMLYEMLAGVHPFRKDLPMDTGNAILNETPPPLARYTDNIPELLQHTVRKMLAKEPDRRYQLMHEVRTDLGQLMEEIGYSLISATAPIVSPRPQWWQRNRLLWPAATALGIIVAGALWLQFFRPVSESSIIPIKAARNPVALNKPSFHVVGKADCFFSITEMLASQDEVSILTFNPLEADEHIDIVALENIDLRGGAVGDERRTERPLLFRREDEPKLILKKGHILRIYIQSKSDLEDNEVSLHSKETIWGADCGKSDRVWIQDGNGRRLLDFRYTFSRP